MKFSDCALGTLKTLFLIKDKFFMSSVFNSLAAILFIFVADAMANAPVDQKAAIAIIVFLANLTGGYLPPKILDKLDADKLFIYVITSNDFENGKELADTLRSFNIPVSTTVDYIATPAENDTQVCKKVLTCKAYATTKLESKVINSCLTEDFKYHIYEGR
jgi:hypothetical protein